MKFDLNILNQYVEKTIVCVEKHPTADLYIYGYYSDANQNNTWDDISIHCRGLIVNGQGEVVEHPFIKFWTYKQYLNNSTVLLNDNQIKKIPQGGFRILEKIDGTMCILYWINDKPYLATQRSFTNAKAIEATRILYEKHIEDVNELDKRYTYIFEAVYPESNVLIDYGNTRDLFLIGMIDKETGMPLELPETGFPKARDFTNEYSNITNFDELASLDLPNQEGFVLYFNNGVMIKLKFPWYQRAHHLLDKIIADHKRIYSNQKMLRDTLNLSEYRISNMDVWAYLASGDYELSRLKSRIPQYFYLMGFESWLQSTTVKILQGKNPTQVSNWFALKPERMEDFDINKRFESPHIFESIVINWKKRYLKSE